MVAGEDETLHTGIAKQAPRRPQIPEGPREGHPDTRLEPGDRLLVVLPQEREPLVTGERQSTPGR